MNRIALGGVVEPIHSYDIRRLLAPLTTKIRPSIVVDLTEVVELHPSALSVLIRERRQAERQGGSLHIVAPASPDATRAVDRVGLLRGRR